MKIAIMIVIVSFMLLDTVLMWCLLRANALYGRNENNDERFADNGSEGNDVRK